MWRRDNGDGFGFLMECEEKRQSLLQTKNERYPMVTNKVIFGLLLI